MFARYNMGKKTIQQELKKTTSTQPLADRTPELPGVPGRKCPLTKKRLFL